MADDFKRNNEGYIDPTAYAALKNIAASERAEKKAAYVISIFKFIARESGFDLMNRIELRDKKTGRIFK